MLESEFIDRLKRRKIVQWTIAYLAAGWGLLQVLDFMRENFAVPVTVVQRVTVLLGGGLLAVIVLAWYHGDRGRQRVSRTELVALTTIVLLTGTGIAFMPSLDTGLVVADGEGDPTVIAVLPFVNNSADPEQAYIASTMTEEISSQIGKIRAFTMISPAAVRQFMDSGEPLSRIQAVLGVGSFLEGTVRQTGDAIRVTVRLIRAVGNDQLWGQDFDRPIADVFAVREEVALRVAENLGATLTPAEQRRLGKPPTDNLAAYALLEQARRTPYQGSAQAIELARQAIALDSTFAEAYVTIGRRFLILWSNDPQSLDSADVAIRRALELDTEAAGAHEALASLLGYQGRLAESRIAYLTALEIDPGNHSATVDFSNSLRQAGRYGEALFWAERALTADPASANAHKHVAQILFNLWDHERTRGFLDESFEKFPDERQTLLHAFYAFYEIVAGRQAEGMERLRTLREEFPDDPFVGETLPVAALLTGSEDVLELWQERVATGGRTCSDGILQRLCRTNVGFLLRMDGQLEQGDEMLDGSWDIVYGFYEAGREDSWVPYELAAISAVRGDADEAFRWLDRAYQTGGWRGPLFELDPMFRSLRDDERFGELVARGKADLERMRRIAFGRVGSRFRQ